MIDARKVERILRRVNAARHGEASGVFPDDGEALLEELFRPSEHLAVYGSLAPGGPNHHLVAPLGGEWTAGYVEGDLHPAGWAAAHGFPAMRWRAGGAPVDVHLLASPMLPGAWAGLDEFEGPDYRRSLVPVYAAGTRGRLLAVANLYECAR